MNVCNKLGCFNLAKPSLMFAGKAGAYPSEALFKGPTLGRPLPWPYL